MAVRINRGDPRRGAGPFANLVTGDAMLETANGIAFSTNGHTPDRPIRTLEEGTSDQDRVRGARSGRAASKADWGGNRSGE